MPFISEDPIYSVVIAGAGGFGLEIFDYINEEIKNGGPAIAGFIDDTPGGKTPEGIDLPCLGTIGDFKPEPGQIVIVALGSAKGRRIVFEKLWANQVKTPAYYHSSVVLSPAAKLNRGVVVCPFSIVNRNAILDKGSVLNVHCSVGHGAFVGAYSVLSPYAALNGDAKIGSVCFLGTRATIYPRVSIGDDCIVDTNTGVRSNTENKKMITSRGDYKVLNIRI